MPSILVIVSLALARQDWLLLQRQGNERSAGVYNGEENQTVVVVAKVLGRATQNWAEEERSALGGIFFALL